MDLPPRQIVSPKRRAFRFERHYDMPPKSHPETVVKVAAPTSVPPLQRVPHVFHGAINVHPKRSAGRAAGMSPNHLAPLGIAGKQLVHLVRDDLFVKQGQLLEILSAGYILWSQPALAENFGII